MPSSAAILVCLYFHRGHESHQAIRISTVSSKRLRTGMPALSATSQASSHCAADRSLYTFVTLMTTLDSEISPQVYDHPTMQRMLDLISGIVVLENVRCAQLIIPYV